MQELNVTSWQLFGHDRLYVNLPDGSPIGWADRANGTITVLHPSYRDAVTDALARQVPDLPALCEAPPQGPPPRVPPQIPPLRRTHRRGRAPVASRERDRAPAPAEVAVPAPKAAAVQEPAEAATSAQTQTQTQTQTQAQAPEREREHEHEHEHEQATGPAPAPAPVSDPPGGPEGTTPRRVLPPLTPGNDLAPLRPGTALRAELAGSGPGELVRAATGALRRRKDVDPRRTALTGERRVGAELKRLTRHGWRLLHSLPLPGSTDIGHLLIGPGGVFTVTTAHHPGASVRLGEGTLQLGDDTPQPYAGEHRSEARRTRRMLESHCAFAVPVGPVLVFVGVTSLDVLTTPPGVRVCRERQLAALAPLTGVLTATQVERVYDVARNREAWLDA